MKRLSAARKVEGGGTSALGRVARADVSGDESAEPGDGGAHRECRHAEEPGPHRREAEDDPIQNQNSGFEKPATASGYRERSVDTQSPRENGRAGAGAEALAARRSGR